MHLVAIRETYDIGQRRTGRHIEHDPRSLNFPIEVDKGVPLRSVHHKRHIPVLDQADLGSCTGNAEVGLLGTEPYYGRLQPGVQALLTEELAVDLYSEATVLDAFKGTYPPDDTGSSGLAVMKAAKNRGLIKAYRHAFGLQHALQALVLRPVITGVNWYEGFDTPNAAGVVRIAGTVRGGHEFVLDGLDVDTHRVRATNSWTADWGHRGSFWFSWTDFDRLLHEDGDVTMATSA